MPKPTTTRSQPPPSGPPPGPAHRGHHVSLHHVIEDLRRLRRHGARHAASGRAARHGA